MTRSSWPARPTAPEALWSRLTAKFPDEQDRGVYDADAHTPAVDHRARPRLHRPRPRDHRRPADRRAAEARHHAQRRPAHGRDAASRPTATSLDPAVQEIFTKYRKTHNDGVFDAYTAGDPRRPQIARHHRPARRLRPRPDHRRLPPGGALRRRPADRATSRREKHALDDAAVHARTSSATARNWPSRSARWANWREMAASYGFDISRPARHRAGSRAVALLRLPRRGQGAERRGDVARPHLDLPRHLLRARSRRGPARPRSRRRS